MNKTIFIKFFQLSIISIPVLLLTGPFMPDLAISLTSIIFILFYSKELIQLIKKEKVILFFFYVLDLFSYKFTFFRSYFVFT